VTTYQVELVVNGRDNASGPLNKVGGVLGNIATIAGGILSAQVFSGIASGIGNMASEALNSYANFERLGMALQSLSARELLNTGAANNMTSAMEMAKGQAAELQGWITKLAILSPFNQEDVAQSFRLAMAYGFTTKEAQRLTQATIDFAAGSGASGYAMQQIALALGQIKAKGKLAGQEVLQLTNAGLDVRGILAKSFGVTTEKLIEMQEKGLIPADKAIEAIVKTLENDFGGAAKAQAATFSGLIASLQDIKSVGLREFFAGTFKAIQPYLSAFVDKFSDPAFMAKIREFGERLGGIVAKLLEFGAVLASGNLSQISDKVVGMLIDLAARFGWTKEQLISALAVWRNFRHGLAVAIEGVRATLSDMGENWEKFKEDLSAETILDVLKGVFGGLSGAAIAAMFAPVGAALLQGLFSFTTGKSILAIGRLLIGKLFTGILVGLSMLNPMLGGAFFRMFMVGGTFFKLGGLISGKIFSGLLVGLSRLSPALGGAFFRMFMVGGAVPKLLAGFGGVVAKLAPVTKFLLPLLGMAAPIVLIAGAIMTLIGAFSLLGKGKLLPMLEPLRGIFMQIMSVAARIVPVVLAAGKAIWESLIQNSEKLAGQVIPWLVEQFQKFADWFSINEPLIKQFIETVAGFIANHLIPAIAGAWKVIEPLLTGIIDLLLNLITFIMQVVVGDWEGAWATLGKTVMDAGSAIGRAVWGLLDWIASMFGTSLEEIGKVWAGNWQLLRMIVERMAQAIEKEAAKIGKGFVDGFNKNVLPGLKQFWKIVEPLFVGSLRNIENVLMFLLRIFRGEFPQAIDALWKTIDEWYDGMESAFFELSNMILGWFGTSWAQIAAQWQTSWGALKESVVVAFQNIVTAITTWLSNVVAAIKQKIKEAGDAVVSLASSVVTGVTTAWAKLVDTVVKFLTNLVTTIGSKVNDFVKAGRDMVAGIVTGFGAAVASWWSQLLSMGANVVNGISQGIQNAWSSFVTWLSGLVGGLIDTLLDMFGINSPSTVTAEMGKNLMLGLAKGINDAASLPQVALSASMGDMGGGAGGNDYWRAGNGARGVQNNNRQTVNYFGPVTVEQKAQVNDRDLLKGLR